MNWAEMGSADFWLRSVQVVIVLAISGAAILGWVAGKMLLGDRIVQGRPGGHPSPVAVGRPWARRRGVTARPPSGH